MTQQKFVWLVKKLDIDPMQVMHVVVTCRISCIGIFGIYVMVKVIYTQQPTLQDMSRIGLRFVQRDRLVYMFDEFEIMKDEVRWNYLIVVNSLVIQFFMLVPSLVEWEGELLLHIFAMFDCGMRRHIISCVETLLSNHNGINTMWKLRRAQFGGYTHTCVCVYPSIYLSIYIYIYI